MMRYVMGLDPQPRQARFVYHSPLPIRDRSLHRMHPMPESDHGGTRSGART